jgi:hypothetical protein
MNELDLVTDLTPKAPLPAPADLAGPRRRLAAAIAAERAGARTRDESAKGSHLTAPMALSSAWRARPARRLALTAAVAAAAAAAVATVAALIIVPGHSPSAPAPGRPAALPPGRVNVAAARFFLKAARVTRQLPAHPPGPDQFVYTQTEEAGGANPGRQWLSAEGNRDGLIQNPGQRGLKLPPCTVAQAQVPQKSPPGMYPRTMKCAEDAGYLPSMPVSPHQLLAYLYRVGIAQPGDGNGTSWAANDFGKAADFLMSTTYLLPAQQAALFELMAQFPAFTIVHGARDAIGRAGVGIKWTFEGSSAEIILNPVSYAYMGDRTWAVPGFHGQGPGAYDGTALVKMAFVNKAGQLP